MNRKKLDKIVDVIFEYIGEIEEGPFRHGVRQELVSLINKDGDLLCYVMNRKFVVTENVPLLEMLESSLDEESFRYIMNKVGNRFIEFYNRKQTVEYDKRTYPSFRFDYLEES